MKKMIFCLMVCFLSLPAVALTYSDFPPNVQRILDERATEIEANGGICVAGRVIMSDGAHISGGQDVLVCLYGGVTESPWVYDDGWFVMGRTSPANPYLCGTETCGADFWIRSDRHHRGATQRADNVC